MARPCTPLAVKFDRTVQHDGVTTCWHWSGNTNQTYGIIRYGRKKVFLAHRYSYERFNGPLIPGLQIDHICRNKLCVNPAHLRQVTHSENMLAIPEHIRKAGRRKSHCKYGHEFTPDNTGTVRGTYGMERYCRVCRRASDRKRRSKS